MPKIQKHPSVLNKCKSHCACPIPLSSGAQLRADRIGLDIGVYRCIDFSCNVHLHAFFILPYFLEFTTYMYISFFLSVWNTIYLAISPVDEH